MNLIIFAILAASELSRLVMCENDYEVANEQVIAVPGDYGKTVIDFSELKTVGRERLVNGTILIAEDMDNDDFTFAVEMYTSQSGDDEYKKVAFDVPPIGVCEGFKKFYKEFLQPSLLFGENTDFPVVGEDGLCPFPAGKYYVNNVNFNTDPWPSQMPRGILKVVINFYKNRVMMGGLTLKLKIEDIN